MELMDFPLMPGTAGVCRDILDWIGNELYVQSHGPSLLST